MANPGQPTISLGTTGDAVKRLERALRRTPNPGLTVDGARLQSSSSSRARD
jgi:hypothetical protein